MAWSDELVIPTPSHSQGWFPNASIPYSKVPQEYWYPYVSADMDIQLKKLIASFQGEVRQSGTLASALKKALFHAEGDHSQKGDIAVALQALSMSATNINPGIFGAQLQKMDFNLVGEQSQSGAFGATLKPPFLSVGGYSAFEGPLSGALAHAVISFAGEHMQEGILHSQIPKIALSATGTQTQTGAISALLKKTLFNAAGGQTLSGTLIGALKKALMTAAGNVKSIVVFDNATDGGNGGTSTRSWTHNNQGNCLIAVLTNTTSSNPTCTYGGTNIPRVYGPSSDGGVFPYTSYISMYALVSNSLPKGNNTLSITQAATASCAGAVSWKNAGSVMAASADTSSGNINKASSTGDGRAAVIAYVGGSSNFGTLSPNQIVNENFVTFVTWSTVIGYGIDTGGGITFTGTHSGAKTGALITILPA